MICLEQPQNAPGTTIMAVEIEVLPQASPGQHYVRLRVRYLIDNQPALEMNSDVYPKMTDQPINWLEKAINTRRNQLSATFGNLHHAHLLVIEQFRLSKQDFAEIQGEMGAEKFPYPFLYALGVPSAPTLKVCYPMLGLGYALTD